MAMPTMAKSSKVNILSNIVIRKPIQVATVESAQKRANVSSVIHKVGHILADTRGSNYARLVYVLCHFRFSVLLSRCFLGLW